MARSINCSTSSLDLPVSTFIQQQHLTGCPLSNCSLCLFLPKRHSPGASMSEKSKKSEHQKLNTCLFVPQAFVEPSGASHDRAQRDAQPSGTLEPNEACHEHSSNKGLTRSNLKGPRLSLPFHFPLFPFQNMSQLRVECQNQRPKVHSSCPWNVSAW